MTLEITLLPLLLPMVVYEMPLFEYRLFEFLVDTELYTSIILML
jgi:hypothetical protein